jgi:RNA polymerase subunit RPABC4/transcription elongation factor Spt4
MAIIACKECTREVSDKARSCPHCGVLIAGQTRQSTRSVKRWVYGILIVGLLAWGGLTTLWLTGIIPVPKPLVGFFGKRGTSLRSVKAPEQTVQPSLAAAIAQSAAELQPGNSAVYRTSVEQLSQDYDANEVAIQSKIDGNPVRVSGSVAQINEDPSGHPVVTLHTSGGDNAEMLLTDDQRSAAAQLSKEDAVEIQCNKMQRVAARLRGTACTVMLVDAGGKLAYLAVSLSGKSGNAPLYIVGPLPRQTCLAGGDSIAAQLTSNPTEHVLSKSCAATARESVSIEGCHLSSIMPAMPDLPSAHLWKYDCVAPGSEARAVGDLANSKGSQKKRAAAIATLSQTPVSPIPVSQAPVSQPAPVSQAASVSQPVETAAAAADSEAPAPKARSKEAGSGGSAPDFPAPAAISTGTTPLINTAATSTAAISTDGGSGSPPPPAPVAVPVSTSAAAPTPPAAAPDDLTPVRSKDPAAAVRIASYCSKITSGAANATTVATRCRQDEVDAWNRLIVQNEFPTLDDTSRRKCNEPPFPDSFVARETCAKYQLHLD